MTPARVLIAPDRFTGLLSAPEAADAIASGWRRHDPEAQLDLAPLSDGGQGFVGVVRRALPGVVHRVGEHGQVFRADDGTVYVEVAPAATSAGMGEVLANVRDRLAPTRVVVGVGGAAGPDDGRRLVEAVGGPAGWPASVPLLASGVETVLAAVRLAERAAATDLLVTGERTFDATSLQGKVPRGVAWVAQRAARPCVVLAARVLVGRREFADAGVDAAYSVEEIAGSAATLEHPADRLADLAERVARSWTPR